MDVNVLLAVILFIVFSLVFAVVSVVLFKRLVNPSISSLKWTTTMYTNLTMTNGITIGVPALGSMYGEDTAKFQVFMAR